MFITINLHSIIKGGEEIVRDGNLLIMKNACIWAGNRSVVGDIVLFGGYRYKEMLQNNKEYFVCAGYYSEDTTRCSLGGSEQRVYTCINSGVRVSIEKVPVEILDIFPDTYAYDNDKKIDEADTEEVRALVREYFKRDDAKMAVEDAA